ncbi:hypothetical protein [Streptomyces sp. RKAG293]|uniref:hypothetical protein n=1 Tax=Streptomyces sp. RKAG293 TaxID=2893403 RepID=UPI00203395D1|nr:hypothetical protein [Streptomyces sp. RKAG293]MCM2416696.1 hypothetical protein [Streptomyces sp. RKAG293]
MGAAHFQGRDLRPGPALGHQAVDILAPVQSGLDYVRELDTGLAPWRCETTVRDFLRHTRQKLGVA